MGDEPLKIHLTDTGEATTWERTPEGYLKVNANLARPGIQDYYAGELSRSALPPELQDNQMRKLKLLRPVDEVFKPESLSTYQHKPLTNNHPPEFIDSGNYSNYQVGMTLGQATPKDGMVNMDMLIQDAKSIEAIEGGKRQLSVGYSLAFDWTSGTDALHGAYDGKMTHIVANHVAIVDKGRAGARVQINDSWKSKHPNEGDKMGDTITRKIGGLSVEFSDQGAQAIDTLQGTLDAEIAKGANLAAKLTDSEKKIDELQGKLDAEKSERLTDAAIEELVTARVTLESTAKALHPEIDCAGKSPLEIKTECIAQLKDGFSLEGKSDEYISAVFDTLEAPKADNGLQNMTSALNDAAPTTVERPDIMAEAQKKMDEINANAWKTKGAN